MIIPMYSFSMPRQQTPSLVVADPEIAEALDLETGEIRPVRDVVGDDYEKALQLRMALRQGIAAGEPLLACPLCAVPVHLVSLAQERRFYLRHETEDGRCPARTKGGLSEERILAMKYDGARESAAHKRMKDIIAESLRGDPDFSGVEIERVWKGEDANSRRKPDVRAVWKGTLPVAFEVQLSTTFLRVIAERRDFYLRHGGLLFWVFNRFDMADARLTQEDVFYNNNRNAFVASEETLAASEAAGSLVLECVWSEPSFEDGQILWSQHRRHAGFGELTVERDKQRAFLFDADAARERCEALTKDWPLRRDFREFWMTRGGAHDDARWLDLRRRLSERGISLPRWPSDGEGLVSLLDTLYSAAEGRPVGWRYADLVKIAHHVFDKHKGHLWPFKLALAAHGRGQQIVAEDATGKWRSAKVKAYREAWSRGDSAFAPDRRHDALVAFLFPEIAADLPKAPS
jgi:hypothetical protein